MLQYHADLRCWNILWQKSRDTISQHAPSYLITFHSAPHSIWCHSTFHRVPFLPPRPTSQPTCQQQVIKCNVVPSPPSHNLENLENPKHATNSSWRMKWAVATPTAGLYLELELSPANLKPHILISTSLLPHPSHDSLHFVGRIILSYLASFPPEGPSCMPSHPLNSWKVKIWNMNFWTQSSLRRWE